MESSESPTKREASPSPTPKSAMKTGGTPSPFGGLSSMSDMITTPPRPHSAITFYKPRVDDHERSPSPIAARYPLPDCPKKTGGIKPEYVFVSTVPGLGHNDLFKVSLPDFTRSNRAPSKYFKNTVASEKPKKKYLPGEFKREVKAAKLEFLDRWEEKFNPTLIHRRVREKVRKVLARAPEDAIPTERDDYNRVVPRSRSATPTSPSCTPARPSTASPSLFRRREFSPKSPTSVQSPRERPSTAIGFLEPKKVSTRSSPSSPLPPSPRSPTTPRGKSPNSPRARRRVASPSPSPLSPKPPSPSLRARPHSSLGVR